jgi:hypothetical protein
MDRLGILRITAAKATNMHCVTGMLIGTAGDKDTVLPQWIRTRHSILAQLGADSWKRKTLSIALYLLQ